MSSECFEKVIQIKRTNPRSASRNICMNIGNVIFGLTFLKHPNKNYFYQGIDLCTFQYIYN